MLKFLYDWNVWVLIINRWQSYTISYLEDLPTYLRGTYIRKFVLLISYMGSSR